MTEIMKLNSPQCLCLYIYIYICVCVCVCVCVLEILLRSNFNLLNLLNCKILPIEDQKLFSSKLNIIGKSQSYFLWLIKAFQVFVLE